MPVCIPELMHIPAPAEDFASPRMHKVTSPLILCLGVRLPEEGWGMTQQLTAPSASPFHRIFCSSAAVPSLAGARMPDLEAQFCSRCKAAQRAPGTMGWQTLPWGEEHQGTTNCHMSPSPAPPQQEEGTVSWERWGSLGQVW